MKKSRPAEIGSWVDRRALNLVILLHVLATCYAFPPWESLRREPLRRDDHPVHTHRIHLYRDALMGGNAPWGYDPAVSAGFVMTPESDVGAKPMQVLGVLLPFAPPGTVQRLFLFVSMLAVPLWTLLACRRFAVPDADRAWIVLVLITPIWFYQNLGGHFYWGTVCFAAASLFAPFVLALFTNFLERPALRIYSVFCAAASLLFLLHVLGPLMVVFPMVSYTLLARPLSWRWRLTTALTPLIVLVMNAFWFLPMLAARSSPPRPWPTTMPDLSDRHMTYEAWSEVLDALPPIRATAFVVGIGLAAYGFRKMSGTTKQRVVPSLLLAALFTIFLKFFGSFIPVVELIQPTRFLLPAFVFLTIPVGVGLAGLATRSRLPPGLSAVGLAIVLALAAPFLHKPVRFVFPPKPDLLARFVAGNTDPADRLLIQSRGYDARVLPLVLDREVIGCTFPRVRDPAQFSREIVLGKTFDQWTPEELRGALNRWGVTWVFAFSKAARELIARTLADPGQEVGRYRAYRVSRANSRFLIGKGQVIARSNRLELRDLQPDDGLVVLRYRYHPAWTATSGIEVRPYAVPEDPAGFVSLIDPPESLILRFDTMSMLVEPWPSALERTEPDLPVGSEHHPARPTASAMLADSVTPRL